MGILLFARIATAFAYPGYTTYLITSDHCGLWISHILLLLLLKLTTSKLCGEILVSKEK